MTSSELAHDVALHLDIAFAGIGQLDLAPLYIPDPPGTGASEAFEVHKKAPSVDDFSFEHSQSEPETEAQEYAEALPSPVHPIPCMQKEFEESIAESMEASSPTVRDHSGDAASRRRQVLELEDLSEAYSSRWTQKPGAKYHPLRKLVAQIVYGIYLLRNGKAVSDQEVVRILQGHVDEIDEFVEDTLADFELAQKDILQRIEHLSLPLEHSRTFNRMLCDRSFRETMIAGNEIIERVIIRTSIAMKRALIDVAAGLTAMNELGQYLRSMGADWASRSDDLSDIYEAMLGNTDGWTGECRHLQRRSKELERTMLRLGLICDEVGKRAGIASRRKTPSGVVGRRSEQQSPQSHPVASRTSVGTYTSKAMEKPLPRPPQRISTNPSGPLPRVSSPRPPQSLEATHRQSLSTSPSLQTLDCLYLPQQRPDIPRPGSSASSPASSRTVRFQDDRSAPSPLGRGQGRNATPQPAHRESSVILKSAMARNSPPRNDSSVDMSRDMNTTPRLDATVHHRIADSRPSQVLSGLGIMGTVNDERPPVIVQPAKEVPVYTSMLARPRPPKTRVPTSDPMPETAAKPGGDLKEPISPSPLRPTSRPMSRSFSMFPSLTDPRERRPRTNEMLPPIAKARSHTDLRAETKALPAGAQMQAASSETSGAGLAVPVVQTHPGATEVGFFGMANKPVELPANEPVSSNHAEPDKPRSRSASASQPSEVMSDIPALSSTAPATSDSMATVSSFSPQTPDDFLPIGGLRSHPVTPTPEANHSRQTSVTALPAFPAVTPANVSSSRLPSFAPAMDIHDDYFIVDAKKRAMIPKRPSLAAMRTLFTRKNAAKDVRLGAGGLGGCVNV